MEITNMNKADLALSHLERAMNYEQYRSLVYKLAEEGKSTSPEQTESNTHYTRLNASRMHRLDKTIRVDDKIRQAFESYPGKQTWLVITESWCGDAAQVIPVINKLADLSAGIELKFVLRDKNPELMDAFLTNGTRSIPKLIAIDENRGEIIGSWGPRPQEAQQMVEDYKAKYGALTPEFKKDLQMWYNKDKGRSIASDLLALIH